MQNAKYLKYIPNIYFKLLVAYFNYYNTVKVFVDFVSQQINQSVNQPASHSLSQSGN